MLEPKVKEILIDLTYMNKHFLLKKHMITKKDKKMLKNIDILPPPLFRT